jgi:hypothetical protein
MEKAVKDEAERLIRELGDGAIQELRERLSAARRRRHARLERFLEKVEREIERRAGQSQPKRQRPARK